MQVKAIRGKFLGQSSFILIEGKDALIIDAGFDVSVVEQFLSDNRLNVLGVFLTHGHFDHTISGGFLCEKGYHVYASEFSDLMTTTNNNLASYFNLPYKNFSARYKLKDNDFLKLGSFEIRVIYTPGHTVDGVCLFINGKLFSGDTLLSGGYGRIDLPTASKKDMQESLKKLFTLDKKIEVYSGHERATKVVLDIAPKMNLGDYLCNQDIAYLLHSEED